MNDKTFLQALILGLGQVSSKILSLIFLFKLSNDLGKELMPLYAYAYIPYSIFADLSCLGFVPGISRLVAKMNVEDKNAQINYLLKVGSLVCLIIGLVFFTLMYLFHRQIISISLFNNLDNERFEFIRLNLFLASFSLIILPLINFYRGFLQGNMLMYPTSISLIIENLFKIVAYLILRRYFTTYSLINIAFLIYFGSYMISFIILFVSALPFLKGTKEKIEVIRIFFKYCIPFGIATMFFTIYQFIDSITLPLLMSKDSNYTVYMFETIRLIFLPIVISQSLGGILNPKISYLIKNNDYEKAQNIALKSTNLIIYILIGLMFLMQIFAKDIYYLFYQQENGEIILYNISYLILFFGLYKTLIGICLGVSRSSYLIIATIISAVFKYILNFILIKYYDYLGAIYANIISISICIFCAYYILNKDKIKIFISNLKTLIIASISIIFSVFIYTIIRVSFSLRNYPAYFNLAIYMFLILGLFYIFIYIFKHLKPLRIK